MPISDVRVAKWDVVGHADQQVEITQRWYDMVNDEPFVLSGHTVRLWLGGSTTIGSVAGATEVTPTIDGPNATFTFDAGATRRLIRTTLDGRVVTAGYLTINNRPRPQNSGAAGVFISDAIITSSVAVSPGPGATVPASAVDLAAIIEGV